MPPPENESKVLNKLFWSKFPANASRFTPPRGIYIPRRDTTRKPKSLRNFPGSGPLKKSPKSMELSSIAAAKSQSVYLIAKSYDYICNLNIIRHCARNRPATPRLSFFVFEALSSIGDKKARRLSHAAFRLDGPSKLIPKGSKLELSQLRRNSSQQEK